MLIVAYVDADWAGDPDTRKSTEAYIIYLNGGAVAWRSATQFYVASSSTHSEYMAFSPAVKEILFLRSVLNFIGFEQSEPSVLFYDNQASRYIAEKPGTSSAKSKGFEVEYHWIRSKLKNGDFRFEKVNSSENKADLLTKFKSIAWFKNGISGVAPIIPG